MEERRIIEAIKGVTRVNDKLITDTYNTYKKGVIPLPGTIPHMVYMCWRMAEELGLVDDEREET